MKIMFIDGARVIESREIKNKKGETSLLLRCAISTSQKKDGSWTEKPNYISVFCSGQLYNRATQMKIGKGSSISVVGSYVASSYSDENGDYLNLSLFASEIAYSSGSIGTTGTFAVWITNAGIVSEPVQAGNITYCDALYDVGYGQTKSTERARLIFRQTSALVQKGKRVNVYGDVDFTLSKGKDGKIYINQTIFANGVNKAPFVIHKDNKADEEAPAPVEGMAAAPAPAPEPQTSFDVSDFEEIGADEEPSFF